MIGRLDVDSFNLGAMLVACLIFFGAVLFHRIRRHL